MGRPKKQAPNRADARYEKKITVGNDVTGKPIRKSFYSKISMKDVDDQIAIYRAQQHLGTATGIFAVGLNPVPFNQVAELFLTRKKGTIKDNSYSETYEWTFNTLIIPHFKSTSINAIDKGDIKNFYDKIAKKYSLNTLKKCRLCLNSVYKLAIDEYMCTRNPVSGVKLPYNYAETEDKRVLSEADTNTVLDYSLMHQYGVYIRILLELGLRGEELCGLQWRDINFNKKLVSICRTVTTYKGKAFESEKTKSDSSRRVLPMSTTLCDCLKSIAPDITNKSKKDKDKILENYLLVTSRGKPSSPDYFRKRKYKYFWNDFKKYRKANNLLEIEAISPHELRHTCGTRLYEKTNDLYAVSKFLGHSSVEITAKIYVKNSAELLRDHLKIV